MRVLLTIFFLFPFYAYGCLVLDRNSIVLNWTGYKTAAKTAVSGTFNEVNYKGKKQADNLKQLLEGASITAALQTPSSGDPARDSNLKNKFFKLIGEQAIAQVTKVEAKLVRIDLKMGTRTVEVVMDYNLLNNELIMNGALDIFDFGINEAFTSISKACYALHEGKTWNDVAIKLQANVTPCKSQ